MADQNNLNEIVEAMKSSMVALSDTMRNFNLRIMDSFRVFQSVDNTLRNFTENINTSVNNVNADLQSFADKLYSIIVPDASFNVLNESIKTSTESLKTYNVTIADSTKVFQNLDKVVNNTTDELQASIKSISAELQSFGDRLKEAVLPDKPADAFNSDLKASAESLKTFNQNLHDNIANLKDFGSEVNKLSQAVSASAQAMTAAGTDLKASEAKASSNVKTKVTGKATDKAPAAPKTSNNYAAASTAGSNAANMLGRVQIAFTAIKKVVEIGVKSIALFNAALLASVVTMQMFTNRVKSYVQAYNPNLVKQFDYILKDITAVIGKSLQPVLIALGVAFRTLGDILIPVMDALAPAFQSLAKAVSGFLLPIFNALGNALINAAPLINKLADEFAKVATELGNALGEMMPELIRYLADYLKNWVETLKAYKNAAPLLEIWSKFNRAFLQAGNILLGAFNSFADYMKKIAMKLRSWLDWFGITTPGKNYVGTNVEPAKTGNSTGMAAREAEYMNVEELSRGLIKAAYGSGQDIARQTLQENKLQNQQLAQINAKLGNRILQPQPFQPGLRMA